MWTAQAALAHLEAACSDEKTKEAVTAWACLYGLEGTAPRLAWAATAAEAGQALPTDFADLEEAFGFDCAAETTRSVVVAMLRGEAA